MGLPSVNDDAVKHVNYYVSYDRQPGYRSFLRACVPPAVAMMVVELDHFARGGRTSIPHKGVIILSYVVLP